MPPSASPGQKSPSPTSPGSPSSETSAKPEESQRVKYVPRISEQKLQEFLKGLDAAAYDAVTDEQVYAIMGEPTRRETPTTFKKNGETVTVYEAQWEEPGSGVKSVIGFWNGRLGKGGMALGIEIPKR